MATKTFYAIKDIRHPLYRTRMLKAGTPIDLDGPTGRLYVALKAVSPDKPARAPAPPTATVAPRAPRKAPTTRKRSAAKRVK